MVLVFLFPFWIDLPDSQVDMNDAHFSKSQLIFIRTCTTSQLSQSSAVHFTIQLYRHRLFRGMLLRFSLAVAADIIWLKFSRPKLFLLYCMVGN